MPTPDLTSGLTRTNPQAQKPINAVKLFGVAKMGGGTFAPTYTYAVASGGTTTTMTATAGHTDSNLRYMKWRIWDEDGTVAYGALDLNARTTPVAITTSALDPLKKWYVEFTAETRSGGKSDKVSWTLVFPDGSIKDNPSGSGQDV